MKKSAIHGKATIVFGEVLQAMLLTAFSPDNFDPFLKRSLDILAGHSGLGPKTRLAIILKGENGGAPKGIFKGFSADDRARLLAGGNPRPAAKGRFFHTDITPGNAKAGRLAALLPAAPGDALQVRWILDITAKVVSARMQGEERDAELRREKDLDSSVNHIEELYLSFPGISTEEISRAVLDEARRLTGSRFGFAGYLDPETGHLKVPTFTGDMLDQCDLKEKPAVFHEFKGLWGWVLKHKEPMFSNDAAADRRSRGIPPRHLKIDKFLGVPAMSGHKLLGILALANPHADYSRHSVRAAQKLARAYAVLLKHKLAEAKQREEDERFRAIIASSKDIIYTNNRQGRITFISPRVRDYGYDPKKLLGRTSVDFAHPDDRDFLMKAYSNLLKTGRTLPIMPYRIRKKDGTYFYAEQKSSIVYKDGEPSYITGVIRDVTEQKKVELLLKESETLMRMVFETAKDAIFIKDMNGMYVKANKACADLLGTTTEGIIGSSDYDYLPKEAADTVFKTDSEVVRTGKTLSLVNLHLFPTGARHVNIVKTPLKNTRGETIGLLGIARDISELKKMEAELAVAKAADALSRVARPVAHDFNNALAAINGYATLIDEDLPGSSPIKKEISLIIHAVKRAAEFTSRFQDFARNPDLRGTEQNGQ